MVQYILFELASGYALFQYKATDEIGHSLAQVQQSIQDLAHFGKYIKLFSFVPFKSAVDALENMNDISEGILHPLLKSFLEMNLPKSKNEFKLGVAEKQLAGAIKSELGISCEADDFVHEIVRGIRFHLTKLVQALAGVHMEKAQLGLGHAYSRAKVKFNVNRSDNMITQAICLLDQMDKDVNTFAMRIREWYAWHFPELGKLVTDALTYAKLVKYIGSKSTLTNEKLPELEEICAEKAQDIIAAAKSSMGTDISDLDLLNVLHFADRVIELMNYRKELQEYLHEKMASVAPNLAALVGDVVGARLISHAGSLTNLAKYPASTVQILGAEKALFRALKTRGKTPKYGLLFHSTFIGRAGQKNKGRISRYLANKCSIASRIDCFTEKVTSKFGEALKQQVEDRLKFYETGEKVERNLDVMHRVLSELGDMIDLDDEDDEMEIEEQPVKAVKRKAEEVEPEEAKKEKKKKKKNKEEKTSKSEGKEEPTVESKDEEKSEKKKKKKEKKKEKKVKA